MKSADVTVIGAGPCGSAAALAYANQGARVVVLEANPNAAKRFAGEWMHPAGARILEELGVAAVPEATVGHGFVVHSDDEGEPICLPYPDGAAGFSVEHSVLVDAIRERLLAHPNIELRLGARAVDVVPGEVTFREGKQTEDVVRCGRIIAADGRGAVGRRVLGLQRKAHTVSRSAGLALRDVELPFEGFGHLVIGGPGPLLIYRIAEDVVRVILDVPTDLYCRGDAANVIWDHYRSVIPEVLKDAIYGELRAGRIQWCANGVRLRKDYGTEEITLVGDAVGHGHPLTAIGMTMGMRDAKALVSHSFNDYVRIRDQESRVPGLLGVLLYDVFTDRMPDTLALRTATYRYWRTNPNGRALTMRFLATEETSVGRFWRSFGAVVGGATFGQARQALRRRELEPVVDFVQAVGQRRKFFLSTIVRRAPAGTRSRDVVALADNDDTNRRSDESSTTDRLRPAMNAAVSWLGKQQRDNGAWEGEVVWSPMLAAQYALVMHATGRSLSGERRRRVLLQFETTQRPDGNWGLHDYESNLFVTVMVYIASRVLGIDADSDMLRRAGAFIQAEGGAVQLPTWGKVWLSAFGLYDWRGVPALRPELWLLPKWIPFHPSRLYCHTRLIYMSMAFLFGRRYAASLGTLGSELRDELYLRPYDKVRWSRHQTTIRSEDLYKAPTRLLKLAYRVLRLLERLPKLRRERALAEIMAHVRFDLKATDGSAIAPVSGLLSILCLLAAGADESEIDHAINGVERWIWEDDVKGVRVVGARSATWDTSWILQALEESEPSSEIADMGRRARDYLLEQQVRHALNDWRRFDRLDPRGGFTFTEAWHMWPVSDCTGEALSALMTSRFGAIEGARARDAIDFILRCQNRDGGFGSFEARRTELNIERLNPAEMFGDSMTEGSYPECTASCLAALAGFKRHFSTWSDPRVDLAIERARKRLFSLQERDGSWPGFWGVNRIYGTMMAVRGLREADVPNSHPALRRAADWFLERQREDGGWGERLEGAWTGRYEPHDRSLIIQTSWAALALVALECADRQALLKATQFILDRQTSDGTWPYEEPAGVFFRTALLDYELYKHYFPFWALGKVNAYLKLVPEEKPESQLAGARSARRAVS